MFTIAVGSMIGMGIASVISHRLGADDAKTAKRAASNSIGLSLLFGAVLTILTAARDYLFYIQMGFVFVFLSMTGFNVARAQVKAEAAGFCTLLGTVVNLALDPLLIFDFKMGVGGAAINLAVYGILSRIHIFVTMPLLGLAAILSLSLLQSEGILFELTQRGQVVFAAHQAFHSTFENSYVEELAGYSEQEARTVQKLIDLLVRRARAVRRMDEEGAKSRPR